MDKYVIYICISIHTTYTYIHIHSALHVLNIYIYNSSIWKGDPAICKNMSKMREYYAEGYQSDKERQILNSYKTQNGGYQGLGHEGYRKC